MVSCVTQAKEDELHEFENWVHSSSSDNNIDIIYKPLKRIKTIKKETSYISADVV